MEIKSSDVIDFYRVDDINKKISIDHNLNTKDFLLDKSEANQEYNLISLSKKKIKLGARPNQINSIFGLLNRKRKSSINSKESKLFLKKFIFFSYNNFLFILMSYN